MTFDILRKNRRGKPILLAVGGDLVPSFEPISLTPTWRVLRFRFTNSPDRCRYGGLPVAGHLRQTRWGGIRRCTHTASPKVCPPLRVATELGVRQRNRDVPSFMQALPANTAG